MNTHLPISIVIFGASGDLTQRKLVPSLFNLFRKGRLPKVFRVVGYGKTAFTDEQFRAHLSSGIKEFASFAYTRDEWSAFLPHLAYQPGSYTELSDFMRLAESLGSWEKGDASRLYYMATPPGTFPHIVDLLGRTAQLSEKAACTRLSI